MLTPDRRTIAAVVYGIPFIWVGVQHFVRPEIFVPIVPDYLGWPEFWVHVTGWTEIGLGIGIMVPRTRSICAKLMVAQLALLYLANLNMWVNDIPFEGHRFGLMGHVLRLAVQLGLMGVAVWLGRPGSLSSREDGLLRSDEH